MCVFYTSYICPILGELPKGFVHSTIATGLATRIESLTGQKPHLVKLEIKRNKLDANREIDEATFGNSDAQNVYYEIFQHCGSGTLAAYCCVKCYNYAYLTQHTVKPILRDQSRSQQMWFLKASCLLTQVNYSEKVYFLKRQSLNTDSLKDRFDCT